MYRMRSALWSATLTLALAATGTPVALGVAAPRTPVVDTSSVARAPGARPLLTDRTSADGITVVTDDDGATLSWTAPDDGRLTDARTQFRIPGGLLLQPTVTGRTYSARALGATRLVASDVAVLRGGRVLAGDASGGLAPSAGDLAAAAPRPSTLVAKDPGAAGRLRTTSFTYSTAGMKVAGYDAKVETRAHVVMPRGVTTPRPVVVLLHGRHSVCYTGDELVDGWPCPPGSRPVPSYLGYLDQQRLLASQGYVTVSISANGINAQDHVELDGGAGTRADLVRRHLALLSGWNRGTPGPRGTEKLEGRLRLSRVVTVGHSRGGEGVSRAAIKARAGDPFRIVGQVLVAPTDFATQVAIGIPTTVLLPSCDGDVMDLQGQAYVDRGVGVAAGDHALRSSVLVLGANHNYFNSEWTPGVAKAPAWDDAEGTTGACGTSSRSRLTATQQRAVGATYVAAAVRTYLTGDASARSLLDGSPVRAASAGPATVLSHAVGGRRTPVLTADRPAKISTRGAATATRCEVVPRQRSDRPCFRDGLSPHVGTLPGSTQMTVDPGLAVRWTARGARVRLRDLPDLGARTWLTMRVAVPAQKATPAFDLVLTDTAGRSATVAAQRAPSRLPTVAGVGRGWAQEVRFRLPARSVVDTRRLARIDLRARSATGTLVVLDIHGVSAGLKTSSASVRNVARLSVPARTRVTATGDTPHVVRIPVTGTRTRSARVWVEHTDARTWRTTGEFRTVRPGQTSIDVRFSVAEDDAVSVSPDGAELGYVSVVADRGAVVDGPIGSATAPPGAMPRLEAVSTSATTTPGGSLRWELRLSAPTIEGVGIPARFAAEPDELRAEDLLPAWVRMRSPEPDPVGPLSRSVGATYLMIEPAATTIVLEIPVRRTAAVAPRRTVRIVVDRSALGAPDLVLTGTVTPVT